MTREQFWNLFLQRTGRGEDTVYIDCFHFDLTEKWSNALLELVLCGQKRATASNLSTWELRGEALPKPGDLSIVTDWAGVPRCVIETTGVTVLPFRDVTWDMCRLEGEGDSLEDWRRGHARFFTDEGLELGYIFSEDMPVVFETFEVVFQS